ncbi:MAG: ATP-binding protein [Syntrophales bacterium]|nr:ATP-binding protein [Syntrophales bacterium]
MTGRKREKSWITLSPWIVIGAVVVLAPIFIFVAVQNIHKQRENTTQLLLEKGAALIRSFEAGTRTGMGMRWGGLQVQKLLMETAQQADIVYLLITDLNGKILADNDPSKIGEYHGKDLDLEKIPRSKEVQWREVIDENGANVFEVFRRFSPTRKHFQRPRGKNVPNDWFRSCIIPPEGKPLSRLTIFVGLDMKPIELAREEDARHTVIMALILLLIGFTGVISLFLVQGYRSARTSLSRIRAFSDNLVENMPIGLLAIDSDGNVSSFNQTAESVLQLSADEILGKKADQVLPQQLRTLIDKLKPETRIVEKEIDCPVKDGNRIPLEAIATLLEEEDGTFAGYAILFRDLTEIKRLRTEIDRSQRLASIGRLAAGIAHEIRNPLSSIKGFATYFKERYKDVPEDQKIAEIMVQEVERLNRVIGQLLEFARPMNIRLKPTSMRTLIQHSLKMIGGQAGEKNIKINPEISLEMDEALIDPDRINQVLLNLYLNAIEAMDDGGTLSVKLFGDDPGWVKIEISDTGVGIQKKDLEKIFDPYFTTKPSGTGLGLAIVHRIIEAHNGEVNLKSEQGKGTTVSIMLPASEGKAGSPVTDKADS